MNREILASDSHRWCGDSRVGLLGSRRVSSWGCRRHCPGSELLSDHLINHDAEHHYDSSDGADYHHDDAPTAGDGLRR